jgi:hypothetical protein
MYYAQWCGYGGGVWCVWFFISIQTTLIYPPFDPYTTHIYFTLYLSSLYDTFTCMFRICTLYSWYVQNDLIYLLCIFEGRISYTHNHTYTYNRERNICEREREKERERERE